MISGCVGFISYMFLLDVADHFFFNSLKKEWYGASAFVALCIVAFGIGYLIYMAVRWLLNSKND